MATRDVLLKAKCKGLVRARWGVVVDGAVDGGFPGGAALEAAGTAWVLAEDDPGRSLGGAIVWSRRHDTTTLHLLATDHTGLLARRAAHFAQDITVWRIEGTALHEATPDVLVPDPDPDPRTAPFIAVFERAGADAVAEGGLLRAEVRGLEVARVEIDETTDEPSLAIGVGKHDREAQREVRGDHQGIDELFEVVRIVAEHRVAEGAGHAAFHLSSERWLRDVVVHNPDLVGAGHDGTVQGQGLTPVPSPARRDDLRAPAPAPLSGVTTDGAPLLVVCSVGIDLDLVPAGIDAWLADGRRPHLRFVVPEGDDYPATRDLVGQLRMPADLVTVPPDWRSR